ncbi:hypothetical protein HHI36_016373 [Cryptolaemus montrouzieri]|uniref:Uncharacterized protein n=1 Tax=Cryptolaemus montrouzieri TaxID=559131 RepID=A0ABD2NJA1_9CUCU
MLCQTLKISSSSDRNKQLKAHLEDLKQKVALLGHRMRRYNARVRRYKQNLQFQDDQQRFYRNLINSDQVSPDKKAANQKQMHEYWSSIWNIWSKFQVITLILSK